MSKGQETRDQILRQAMRIASTQGLEGVTIGDLARRMELSKSGLFAHFRSKEKLQVAIVEATAETFVRRVVRPAIAQPRGEPRLVAIFENWLAWASTALPGGCLFVAAATEFDDRPGAVRDSLVLRQKDWIATLSKAARLAQEEGHLRADVDPDQIAFEIHGFMLGAHHAYRLLDDKQALVRARRAFDALLSRTRT